MEALNAELARKTVNRYACSNCWGDLELAPDLRENGMYFVTCKKCKEETKGYVSQYFVNTRRTASEFEKRDVTRMLKSIGVIASPKKSTNELMKELGF